MRSRDISYQGSVRGLPFSREAEEAFLEVGVLVLMSLPDEENPPKVGPDAA